MHGAAGQRRRCFCMAALHILILAVRASMWVRIRLADGFFE